MNPCVKAVRPRRRLTWIADALMRVRTTLTAAMTPRPAAPAQRESLPPAGLRVLVADDNPANLGHACELLRCWGITPTVAADGSEAVSLACRREFDLILMDLQMPLLDGLGATKRIRAFEAARSVARTPVLAYTSHAVDDRLLRQCGLDGVLEKPCSALDLQQCLQRWCVHAGSPKCDRADVGALASSRG